MPTAGAHAHIYTRLVHNVALKQHEKQTNPAAVGESSSHLKEARPRPNSEQTNPIARHSRLVLVQSQLIWSRRFQISILHLPHNAPQTLWERRRRGIEIYMPRMVVEHPPGEQEDGKKRGGAVVVKSRFRHDRPPSTCAAFVPLKKLHWQYWM